MSRSAAHAVIAGADGFAAKPATSRPPGPRSIATTERILTSAEILLRKDGERFTLGDVASAARVSMASIYSRYPSKLHLIREVQARVLGGLLAQVRDGLEQIISEGGDLEWRATRVVDVYAESHAVRASVIRAFYSVARDDLALRAKGVETVKALVDSAVVGLMGGAPGSADSAGPVHLRVIARTFLHALASYLGFGYGTSNDDEADWLTFKATLARMVYLAAREAFSSPAGPA